MAIGVGGHPKNQRNNVMNNIIKGWLLMYVGGHPKNKVDVNRPSLRCAQAWLYIYIIYIYNLYIYIYNLYIYIYNLYIYIYNLYIYLGNQSYLKTPFE